jgi:hypothetical protein
VGAGLEEVARELFGDATAGGSGAVALGRFDGALGGGGGTLR